MIYLRKLAVSAAVFTLALSTAFGAGFALNEYSARGNAMSGAVLANKAEAASVAYNPALITELDGINMQIGVTAVKPEVEPCVNGYCTTNKNRIWPVPHAYVTYQWDDKMYLGFGFFNRFGLGGTYDRSWPGASSVYKIEVQQFSFNPVMAYKFTDDLSIAAGLEFSYMTFYHNINISAYPGNPQVTLDVDSYTVNSNFALAYKPSWAKKWGFGLTYRPKSRPMFKGTSYADSDLGGGLPRAGESEVGGSIGLPAQVGAGLSFTPNEKWVFEGDVVYSQWSRFESISIIDRQTSSPRLYTNSIKNWKDVFRFNIGTEYQLNPTWALRAGYSYDQSPLNGDYYDAILPCDDRHIFSGGVGYKHNDWGLDLSYNFLYAAARDGKNVDKGQIWEYRTSHTHMAGLTFSYKFK